MTMTTASQNHPFHHLPQVLAPGAKRTLGTSWASSSQHEHHQNVATSKSRVIHEIHPTKKAFPWMAAHLRVNQSATHHVPRRHPASHPSLSSLGENQNPSRSISVSLQPIPVTADPFAKKKIGRKTSEKQAHPDRGVSSSFFPVLGR